MRRKSVILKARTTLKRLNYVNKLSLFVGQNKNRHLRQDSYNSPSPVNDKFSPQISLTNKKKTIINRRAQLTKTFSKESVMTTDSKMVNSTHNSTNYTKPNFGKLAQQ